MSEATAYDVIVVGSGAAGMTAAIRAAELGASVLVVEKAAVYGGTSATSGGGLWLPCNHLMAEAGVADDRADALAYLRALAGNDVPDANIVAFVDSGAQMLRWLYGATEVRYVAMAHYADYYQEQPGARLGARSIDPVPYEARRLGAAFAQMQAQHRQVRVMGLIGYTNGEGAVLLSKAPGWRKVIAGLVWRYVSDIPGRLRSRRSRRLTMGNALVGGLRKALADREIPLWLGSPAQRLRMEAGRVTGVIVSRDGRAIELRARKGVVLAAGGFEHSQALREAHLPKPTDARWSAASPTNQGDMLRAAQAIGAAAYLLDEAWWSPTITLPGEDRARALFTERSMPGAIVVNREGRRFFNESTGYTAAAQAMFGPGNLPAWLIFDSRYRREYPFGPLLPGGMRLDWMQQRSTRRDLLGSAPTLRALGERLGVDAAALETTVGRFNDFARRGVDGDFHRGENSYDLIYGDVRVQPNPCLAPIVEAPFYGVEIHAGDIGTKGGVSCDEDARVLDAAGRPIAGLYAVGNVAASVTGRHYPGAGATLGPAMTFAWRAANHLCRVEEQAMRFIERYEDVRGFDLETEIAIVGFGGSGGCAALEARRAGREVMLFERSSGAGGSTALSACEMYLGGSGGTALQKALGIEDTSENFRAYLDACFGLNADPDRVDMFVEGAAAHFDWMAALGVRYKPSLFEGRDVVAMTGDSLQYSGNERVNWFAERAKPVPRAHLAADADHNGGQVVMAALRRNVEEAGVDIRYDARALRLVQDDAGAVRGLVVRIDNRELRVRAGRGVILCAGGFIMNERMTRQHLPHLEGISTRHGNPGDMGDGILMGVAAGGHAINMGQAFFGIATYPPAQLTYGILVNRTGQRFVAEDSYISRIGDAALKQPDGLIYLFISDKHFARPDYVNGTEIVAVGETVEEVEREAKLPEGTLQHSVAFYNAHAGKGVDPLFDKAAKWLEPFDTPPFALVSYRLADIKQSAFTLGGLDVLPTGEVVTPNDRRPIPGLFAAGRTVAGIPRTGAGYASGMSIADVTFFGRAAGRQAAQASG